MPTDVDTSQDTNRSNAHDQQGAKPLAPHEQDSLNQIEAGLKNDAATKTQTADRAKTNASANAAKPTTTKGSSAGSSSASTAGTTGAAGGASSSPVAAAATKVSPMVAAAAFAGNNRGKLMGGGAVGLILAILIGSFAALLPLKLESMMENIFEKRIGNRVEYYMEERMQNMVEKYLEASVGSSDDEFEKSIVATGSPLRDLYKTWRVNKFESQLQEHQGIRFQKNPDGTIDVFKDGELAGNLTKPQAIDAFNEAVRSETQWYQFYKRMHLRTWMKDAYGINKWDFFLNTVNKIKCTIKGCTSDNAAEDEVKTQEVQDAEAPTDLAAVDTMGCALSEAEDDCIDDPNDPANPGLDGQGVAGDDKSNDGNQDDGTIEGAASSAEQDATAQTEKEIADNGGAKLTERILTKFLGEALGKQITNFIDAAAGPLIVIGLVDMASRIDHFLYNGGADKVIVGAHEVEYATQFAEWMVIGDNWKDGKTVSGDEFNAIMQELNGTENAASFEQVYGTGTGGQSLTTVADGNGGTVSDAGARSINETAHPIENFYQAAIANVIVPGSNISLHEELNIWYDTGGKVWGLIQDVTGFLFSKAIDIIKAIIKVADPPLYQIFDSLMNVIGKALTDLMMLLIKSAVDGTETGPDLINGIDAGATVTGMGFARQLGAPQISANNAKLLDGQISDAQQAQDSQLSLADQLFSQSFSHSLVNNIAFAMPATPGGAVSDTTDYLASIVANPFRALASIPSLLGIISPANAAADDPNSPANNYGMIDWGYTPAQLQGDDTAALNTAWANAQTRLGHVPTYGELIEGDCPTVPDPTKDPNLCRLDIAAIQSLGAKYTSATAPDGGIGD
jgi:hypothetical protein